MLMCAHMCTHVFAQCCQFDMARHDFRSLQGEEKLLVEDRWATTATVANSIFLQSESHPSRLTRLCLEFQLISASAQLLVRMFGKL